MIQILYIPDSGTGYNAIVTSFPFAVVIYQNLKIPLFSDMIYVSSLNDAKRGGFMNCF